MRAGQVFEFGPFRLDVGGRVLLRDGRIVPLQPKVLDTLVLLMERRGELVDKEELIRAVWPDTYVEQNSLTHNISVLRRVLGVAPDGKSYIETAPRRGYRFAGDVRIAGSGAPEAAAARANRRWMGQAAAVAAVALVILVAGVVWIRPAPVPALRITPLTSYRGSESFPTFSPDGRLVAFVWNGEREQQYDIYVKTIGVDPPRRLTFDADMECHLAWSPDGASIAFSDCGSTAPDAPPGGAGLYVMPASGGQKRKLAYIHDGGSPEATVFTWARDAKYLITAKALGGSAGTGLFLIAADSGAEQRRLTWPPPGSWDTTPAISPDGRTLAFVRAMAHGIEDLYLLALDQQLAPRGEPRRLTFEDDFVTSLAWTNDGRELVYAAGRDGGRGVWRVRARSGSVPRQSPGLAQAGMHLALSRDGRVAFSRRSCDFDIWRAELDGRNPAKASELIVSTFSDAEPKYSPDGKSIAFQSNRSGAMEIWRGNADGSEATQLTSLRAEAGSPAWSPDGSEIAFDCRADDQVDVYIVGVNDRQVRRLTNHPGVQTTPSWSRDGKWIYFGSKRTGRLETWKTPSAGGTAVQVTQGGGFFALESVDRKSLYYAKTGEFPTALWRKSLESGSEEPFIDSIGNWFYFAVFPDGIAYIPDRSGSVRGFQLKFYEFAAKGARTLAEVDKWAGVGFSVSPDRRSVLFAPCESRGADLMLVENFR